MLNLPPYQILYNPVNLEDGCTVWISEQGKLIEIDPVDTRFLCFREDSGRYMQLLLVK